MEKNWAIEEYGLEHYKKCLEDKPTDRLPVKLTVSFDYGWWRAASRRLYNSKCGHGFIVGQYTGKIVGCVIFSKNCKHCELNSAQLYKGYSHEQIEK